jgi:hypothetical protein
MVLTVSETEMNLGHAMREARLLTIVAFVL